MQIKKIEIMNLGPIRGETLDTQPLTILVGQNGVGKSTILKALSLFYNDSIKVDERDFYNETVQDPISIKITYDQLTEHEKSNLSKYIQNNEFTVEKIIKRVDGKTTSQYHGSRFVNPEFQPFRDASGRTELTSAYNGIREAYPELPEYTKKEEAEAHLQEWESSNTDRCTPERDDGQFFGYKNVGKYKLIKHTKFISIPAVHKAVDETKDQRNSSIGEITQLVVKGKLTRDPEFQKIEADAKTEYDKYLTKAKDTQLKSLSDSLSDSLNLYFPGTGIKLDWKDDRGVSVELPETTVDVLEEGYANTIDRCGHGLQRAFILSLFQELALLRPEESEGEEPTDLPGLIICIEEPELYQHPDRQRHLFNTLLKLTKGQIGGVAASIQVIYATHSPLMLSYRSFDQIRLLTKVDTGEEGLPKETRITDTSLAKVCALIEKSKSYTPGSISPASLQQRLIHLMTPWINEGFFAKLIVIVEGIKDRALILGRALYDGYDYESMGIAVIPCLSKFNIPEAVSIFQSLDIPIYTVWDADWKEEEDSNTKNHKTANCNIQRCFDVTPEDFPDAITDNYGCIKTDLENEFKDKVKEELFSRVLQQYCDENELGEGRFVMENPLLVQKIIELCEEEGGKCDTLGSIRIKINEKYHTHYPPIPSS